MYRPWWCTLLSRTSSYYPILPTRLLPFRAAFFYQLAQVYADFSFQRLIPPNIQGSLSAKEIHQSKGSSAPQPMCFPSRFVHLLSNVCGLSIFPTDGVASHDMDLVKLGLQKQNFPCDPVGLYELESFFQRWFFDSCHLYQDENLCALFGFTICQQYVIAFLRLTLWYLKDALMVN